MNAPYGLEVIETCVECKLRTNQSFCNFSTAPLIAFNQISHQHAYPGGSLLFAEGQVTRGVSVLCSARVKLSTTSREGKILILKIAGPGDVLGLSAVLSGVRHEITAVTAVPCRLNFVKSELLLSFLARYGEEGLRAARAVSKEYQDASQGIQEILLAPSSAGKIAKLLLSWAGDHNHDDPVVRVRSVLTHEEIAQMIGSSRETVTRSLSDLKRKQLISLEGSTLIIRNCSGLEELAS